MYKTHWEEIQLFVHMKTQQLLQVPHYCRKVVYFQNNAIAKKKKYVSCIYVVVDAPICLIFF